MVSKYSDLIDKHQTKSKYSDAIDEYNKRDEVAYNLSVKDGLNKQPDRQAEVNKFSKELNVPTSYVDRNLDMIKAEKKKKDFDYKDLSKNNPGLAKFFQDPNNAAIAHDDLDNLKKIESSSRVFKVEKDSSIFKDIGKGLDIGYTNAEKGGLYMALDRGVGDIDVLAEMIAEKNVAAEKMMAKAPEYSEKFNEKYQKESAEMSKAYSDMLAETEKAWEKNMFDGIAEFGKGSVKTAGEFFDLITTMGSSPKAMTYQASQSAINSVVPMMAGFLGAKGGAVVGGGAGSLFGPGGTVIGATIGGAAGYIGSSTVTGTALQYSLELEGYLSKNGVDTKDPKQIAAAFRNPEILKDIRTKAFTKSLTNAAFEASTEFIGGAVLKGIKGASVAKKALKAGGATVIEAAGEGGGEFAGTVAAEGYDNASVSEGLLEAGVSIISGGFMGSMSSAYATGKKTIPGKVSELKNVYDKSQEAKATKKYVEQLSESLNASKLKGRDLEVARNLVHESTGGASVFFQSDEFDDHWTRQGENPAEKADELLPGGRAEYENAKQEGRHLEIPLSDYVTKMSDEESFADLNNILKREPDAMSAIESDEAGEFINDELKKIVEESKIQSQEAANKEQAMDVVSKDQKAQMIAAGSDNKLAGFTGDIFAAGLNGLGKITGINALEQFQKRPVYIKGDQKLTDNTRAKLTEKFGEIVNIDEISEADANRILKPMKQDPVKVIEKEKQIRDVLSKRDQALKEQAILDVKLREMSGVLNMPAPGKDVGDATKAINQKPVSKAQIKRDIEALTKKVAESNAVVREMTDDMVNAEIDEMVYEVQQAEISTGLTKNKRGEFDSRWYENTFPEYYRDLGVKNKEDMQRLASKKSGKPYERMVEIAKDRLENGYESKISGQNMPNETYLALIGKGDDGLLFQKDASGFYIKHGQKVIAESLKKNSFKVIELAKATKAKQTLEKSRELKTKAAESFEGAKFKNDETGKSFTINQKGLLSFFDRLNDRTLRDFEKVNRKKIRKSQGKYQDALTGIKGIQKMIAAGTPIMSTKDSEIYYTVGRSEGMNIALSFEVKGDEIVNLDVMSEIKKIADPSIKVDRTTSSSDNVSLADFQKIVNAGRKDSKLLFQEDNDYYENIAKTEDFKEFFEGSKVVDENGEPLVVYHGTTQDFGSFDIEKGDVENDFGKGVYFSNNPNDVEENYSGEGPDLTNKIERRAEQIEQEQEIEYDDAKEIARTEMIGHGGVTMPVYVSIKNPVYIGGDKETVFEYDVEYDENDEFIGESGLYTELLETLDYVGRGFDDFDIGKLELEVYPGEGIRASELVEKLKESEALAYAMDENGNLASGEIIRQTFEQMGFDGIIDESVNVKFGTKRKIGQAMAGVDHGTVHYIAFNPKSVKSIFNKGEFDYTNADILLQQDGKKRGAIDLSDSTKLVVSLFKDKNATTEVHEILGHAFLEHIKIAVGEVNKLDTLNDDQKKFMEDMAIMSEELGIESFDDIQRESHEKFARMIEAYIMEGKAPSKKLEKAFNTFKTWFKSIYRDIMGLSRSAGHDVKLSDDMKDIFNRLFATDDEINEVKEEMGYSSDDIISVFEALNYKNDKDLNEILDAHREADQEAELELYRKQVNQAKKKKTKEYNNKKREVKKQIAEHAETLPAYIAIDSIVKNTLDGVKIEGYDSIKMSTELLKSMSGEKSLSKIDKRLYKKDGVDPAVTAAILGFNNPKEMIDLLSNTPKKKDFIEMMTNKEMEKLYPDFMSAEMQDEFKTEAINSVHSDSRIKAMKLTFDIMMKNAPAKAKALIQKTAKSIRSNKDIKKLSEARIDKQKIKDTRATIFKRSENRHRKDAVSFLLKGDFVKAADRKVKEILNHQLYRDSMVAQESVAKRLGQAKKRLVKSDKDLAKSGQVEMFKAAQSLMSKFNMMTEVQSEKLADYMELVKKYDPAAFEKVSVLTETLASIEAKDYKDLTNKEFNEIMDVVDALYEVGKNEKSVLVDGKRVDKEQAVNELLENITEIKNDDTGKQDTFWKGFKAKVMGIEAYMTRFEHLINFLDKDNITGPFRKYIFNRADEAQTEYEDMLETYYEKLNVVMKDKFKGVLSNKQKFDVTKYFKGARGDQAYITQGEIVMSLVHSGNDSNKQKLLLGRNWGSMDINGNLNTKDFDAFIADMMEQGIITKDHMDGVQEIWDLFEEIKPSVQKTHKDVYGYFFKEIEVNEVETPWGTYRGGYAPATTDPLLVNVAQRRENEISTQQDAVQFSHAGTPKGFTMERVQAYNAALSLDFKMIRSNFEQTIRFAKIQGAVTDISKIINDDAFIAGMDEKNKKWHNEVFTPWLARLATQQTSIPGKMSGERDARNWVNYFRKNANQNLMFANVVNTMENVLEISKVLKEVKKSSMASSIKRYAENPGEVADMVFELSPAMAKRMKGQIHDINEAFANMSIEDDTLKGQVTKIQRFASHNAYFLQRGVQNVLDIAVWNAAYNEGVVKYKDSKAAVKHADSVIRRLLGSNRPIDLANIEAGTAFMKVFYTFYSYFLNNGNLARYTYGGKAEKTRGWLYAIAIPSILSKIFRGEILGGEDEDELGDDIWQNLILAPIEGTAATLPGGAMFSRLVAGQFTDAAYDDRLSMSPMVGALEAGRGVSNITKKLLTDGKDVSGRDIRDFMSFLGLVSGLPLNALGKPVAFMMDLDDGKQRADNTLDYTKGILTGRSGKK